MRVALGSLFRNSAGLQVNRWARQVARLQDRVRGQHELHLRLVWGDSTDRTREELQACCEALEPASYTITERSHGGPVFGSTEDPARMRALSWAWNGLLEQVGEDIDALAYVESDLLWQPEVFLRLVARLERGADVVAPLTFAGVAFYDIWAFRALDGRRWSPFHPYHPDARFDGELTRMNSVGSCLVMRGEVARRCRIRDDQAIVGFCADARAQGYGVFADTGERVDHP